MKDRRSGEERRTSNRYGVDIEVEWETSVGRQTGRLSDISLDGCFVWCSGRVVDGEAVKIMIPLEDGMRVQYGGRIANHVADIGFGVNFEQLTVAQRDVLAGLVRQSEPLD